MNSDTRHIVIVGGGQAGAQVIDSLRRRGSTDRVTLVSDEGMLPYQRPPLSKQYLAGQYDTDWLLYRPVEFYSSHRAEVILGQRAVSIDRDRGELELADGGRIAYDQLVLTTGCRAPPAAGAGRRTRGCTSAAQLE